MRVVVAAEEQCFAERIVDLINHRKSIALQAVVPGVAATRSYVDECDTMILVLGPDESECLAAVRNLKTLAPSLQIIIANIPSDPGTIVRFLEAGATAYLTTDYPLSYLPNVLKSLEDGEVNVEPRVAALMLDRIVALRDQVPVIDEGDFTPALTARQQQVLSLIARDKSNEEISAELFIEVGTVKNHVHRILQKLGARDRREEAQIARSSDDHQDGQPLVPERKTHSCWGLRR